MDLTKLSEEFETQMPAHISSLEVQTYDYPGLDQRAIHPSKRLILYRIKATLSDGGTIVAENIEKCNIHFSA